jgi:hypothetical protein
MMNFYQGLLIVALLRSNLNRLRHTADPQFAYREASRPIWQMIVVVPVSSGDS